MDRLGCMADHWLFGHLDAGGRQRIMDSVRRRSFTAGETLFSQGDPATAVFLVTAGRIRLFKTSEEGREIVLGYLGPHDLFGEQALFERVTHAVSGSGVEPGALCVCEKADFERFVQQDPALALAVVRVLGAKLRETTELWASGAGAPVRERVSYTLVQLARKYGEHTPDGLRLGFRLTHEELSALVGASRVMVTYAVGELRREGLLHDEGHLFVVAPAMLQVPAPAPGDPPATACPCFGRAA